MANPGRWIIRKMVLTTNAYGRKRTGVMFGAAAFYALMPDLLVYFHQPFCWWWFYFSILLVGPFLFSLARMIFAELLPQDDFDTIAKKNRRTSVFLRFEVVFWYLSYLTLGVGAAAGFLFGKGRADARTADLMFVGLAVALVRNQFKRGKWSIANDLSRKPSSRVETAFQILDAIGLLFTPKFRAQVYRPVIEEDKADLLEALSYYQTRKGRIWLVFCFIIRCPVRIAHLAIISGWASLIAAASPWIRRLLK
jgi:hypothetical protein